MISEKRKYKRERERERTVKGSREKNGNKRTLIYFERVSVTVPLTSCFFLFRFNCFAYVELATALLVWLYTNQSNTMSAVQQYFPLQSK